MQTTHTSTSLTHIDTNLSHASTTHCPQCKDIKIISEEKEELKRRRRRKEGRDEKYVSCTKSLKRP